MVNKEKDRTRPMGSVRWVEEVKRNESMVLWSRLVQSSDWVGPGSDQVKVES